MPTDLGRKENRNMNGTPNSKLHLSEPWFHGEIGKVRGKQPRQVAEELLTKYQKGHGTFLVRNSGTFIGDYTVSFWVDDQDPYSLPHIYHIRIKEQSVEGQILFSVSNSERFESLYSLIMYYRDHSLIGTNMCLNDTVPQQNNQEKKL